MASLLDALTFLAALGSGLMAGLYFAFSAFIMTAFGRLPRASGMAAMNAINTAILNPLFFIVFFGTAAIALGLGIAAVAGWPDPRAVWLLAGAFLYLAGNILVTIVCNVPLNNALAAALPDSPQSAALWSRYLSVWTAWNHVRTVACLAATACFTAALR